MKTDSQLKQDVVNELKWDPSINETHIGVSVKNGIVTLSGHVTNYGEKYGAEKAAKRVFGVKAVADEIDVKLASSTKRNDEDVAAACLAALQAHVSVPADKIKITVNTGWVTLEGTVDWQYQKTAAESAIRYLAGVTGITDAIKLAPRATVADIKEKIEAAFKRSARIDASHVTVEAHDGKVTLRGKVHSLQEKTAAQYAAWAAPGVFTVENDLVVTT